MTTKNNGNPKASDVASGIDAGIAAAFEDLPIAIVLFTQQIIWANRQAEKITGYERTELTGMAPIDLVDPDFRPESGNLADLMPERSELKLIAKDRKTRWVEFRLARLEVGEVETTVVTAVDITDRKNAQRAEKMLSKAVQNAQIGVTITDTWGTILYTNRAEALMHGYTVDEITGQDVRIFAPQRLWQPMSKTQLAVIRSHKRESLNVRKDGTIFPVRLLSDVVNDDKGEPIALVTTTEDITERRAAEQALKESEERYALAASGANDGLWDWDLREDRVYFSPRWKDLLGHTEDEIGDQSDEWFSRVHPEDAERLRMLLDNHLVGNTPHFECDFRMRHADGRWRWMLCRGLAVRDVNDVAVRIAGSQTDITQRKLAEQQLLHNAFHDGLTGLPNRTLFMDRLEQQIRRSKRRHGPLFAVLFIDLDRFKLVNENYGHLMADRLLKDVSRRLARQLRPGDTLAKLPGAAFAVLLEEVGSQLEASAIADRVHQTLAPVFFVGNDEIYLSASMGLVVSTTEYERPEDVMRDADTALYRAKAAGGSGHCLFDGSMRDQAVAQLKLETSLRRALDRAELRVRYQPIIELAKGGLAGFEALVRWQHPTHGTMGPTDFIPVAEETGLIVRLGEWVFEEAVSQLKSWQDQVEDHTRFSLAVNLSVKELMSPGHTAIIRRLIESSAIDPGRLTLEVTESAVMERADAAAAILTDLKALGVNLAIDDFGTGYSSLSYLQRLPFDTLKIDRSFVRRACEKSSSEIVAAIVSMAHNLGMKVVAEGVETTDQAERLRSLGCEFAQGFLYAEALEPQNAGQMLMERPD